MLDIRKATLADIDLTFRWASDKTIRKYSFSKEIEKTEHDNWYKKQILNPYCEYYIITYNNESVGSIRYDINSEGKARVSYLLDPEYHGLGLGKKVLELGEQAIRDKKEIKSIYGQVMKQNIPSYKIFVELGYTIIEEIDSYYTFEKIIL